MEEGVVREKKYNLFSILAIIFAFVSFPLGLIFAIIALVQIKKTGEKGKGLAIAAIIIPIVLILLVILGWFFVRTILD